VLFKNRKRTSVNGESVYVLNKRGEPLMPCSPRKAKVLLKQGKAKVVKRSPFTIQLTIATGETKQEITLGIDTGYSNVGASAVTEKKELLSATFRLRTNISDLLKERAMYRRGRRNRLWYRKPRWANRVNARKEGRLMPSVLHKVNTHISIIEKIKKILPISKVILETGLFDMAKMENDKIRNYQYQKGEMLGFENIKSYVLSRDSHQCFFKCKDAHKLEIHHIKFRSQGGTDNPNNLITLCSVCHKKVHAGKLELNVKKHKELKSATMMNIIRKRLLEFYLDAVETFGYETKVKRREIELEK
jgi:N6-L-threonylcarbamoyladenine synthase